MNKEEDIELMQVELDKLYQWGRNNNMEFNGKKFQVIRYGRNINLKESTEYFVGDYQEVIARFSSLRDLGVEINEDGTFIEHIENICKKVRQKSGWILRSFCTREAEFMRHMFNTLVQPHIDYCSQLWMPQEGQNL